MSEKPKQATRHAMTMIMESLGELGKLALPLPTVIQIHRASKALGAIAQETEELRQAIVATRLPEGAQQLTQDDPGYADVVAQLDELYNSPVDLPAFAPVALPVDATLTPASYGVLVAVGVLPEPED